MQAFLQNMRNNLQ